MIRYLILWTMSISTLPGFTQNVLLKPAVLANGASLMNNASITLKGTVGQAIIGNTQIVNLKAGQGFWPAVSSVSKVITSQQDLLLIVQQIKVYPNPASTTMKLEFQLSKDIEATITIKDILGRDIGQYFNGRLKPGHQLKTMDVSHLAIGQYYVIIRSSSGMLSMPVQVWR